MANDLRTALERILEEPKNTLSDGKALKAIIRIAKDAITSPLAPEQVVAEAPAPGTVTMSDVWLRERADELVKKIHARIGTWGEQRKSILDFAREFAALNQPAPAAPLLMQDENSGRDGRRYNEWHASRLNAREAAAALGIELPPPHEAFTGRTGHQVYTADQVRAIVHDDRKERQLAACNFCLAQAAEAREAARSAATPAAPSAGVSSHEHDIALREGYQIRACEDYFSARSKGFHTIYTVTAYEAGFKKGWEDRAVLAQPAPVQAGAQQAAPSDMDQSDLEFALAALHAIAGNEEVVDGCIEKIVDIRRARPRAAEAYRRLARCEKVWASAFAALTQAGAGDAKGGA